MAKIVKPLNDKQIKQAKALEKEYSLSDGAGLQLVIRPNGTKTWLFKYYRPFSKKRTNISFGQYPLISLADARKKREDARALLANDIDPKEHKDNEVLKQQEQQQNTLQFIAEQWFEIKKTKVTEAYAEDVWRSLCLHVFPNLGEVPIDKLSAQLTITTIKPLAAKGSLETVKRVCQRLNEIMTYAVNTGFIFSNPLAGIKAAFESPKKQHMPALAPAQLPELMKALNTASIKLTTRCLIEWQLHTMTRPSEAAGARWDEIDFEEQVWLIPAERMKKNKSHEIPLTPQALGLLEAIRPLSGHREFIFPADRNPRSHTNEQTANAALKRMGFKDRLVAHGLRALASTTLNEQGFDPDIIESALAHVDKNEVRRAYNRSAYLERRRKMMQWWSEHIEQAATGNMSLAKSSIHLRAV